ncbi:FAD-dependent oxidoreductase [Novosphingobium guangzhouense]|uniref:FAD-dependent oxidoreductase n=1 Tax=Novosphingobium guangzhouense TaxID=1850347 RepID=A0A2K2FYD5_9SPHN|nr:FAD-dependent oxidoreductase [Novosphingobium guangzhouense]
MTCSVAIVGAGPTAIYTLNALLALQPAAFELTIFEKQPFIGKGTPYRPGWNDPAMLSNIASIEIPPLATSLVAWLHAQSSERLAEMHIDAAAIDDRTFYPRVVLGEFFSEQMQMLLEQAATQGTVVTVRTRCEVLDAVSGPDGMILRVQPHRGECFEARFDHVILATGHQWPEQPEVSPGYFASPWPASEIEKIPATHVGIRGSSLTAIDAAVALAIAHGDFVEAEDGGITYVPAPGTEDFRMTMLSRKGLLPEADFYFPIPYEPLSICTAEAINELIAADDPLLLDRTFELFKRELAAADASYAQETRLASLNLEDFCEGYFSQRLATDPFEWARHNLTEAQRNYERHHVVAWRYAILRMHEVIEGIVPYLGDADFLRFSKHFKTVFIDDYATVPHESILRMLALHDAGKLEVIALGEDYQIDPHGVSSGALLTHGSTEFHFPVFIEATGQRALSAKDFPFPSLREQGIVHDVDASNEHGPLRGIAIDDRFHPISSQIPADQLFCVSLPFIMGRHPFVQGITSSHEIGQIVAAELVAAIGRRCNTEIVKELNER